MITLTRGGTPATSTGSTASASPSSTPTAPVAVSVPKTASAAMKVCHDLIHALPSTVDGRRQRPVSGAQENAAAWGDPPIVLRCGVPVASPGGQLITLDGVTWNTHSTSDAIRWTSTGRKVTIDISVPAVYTGQGPLVATFSPAIAHTVPAR